MGPLRAAGRRGWPAGDCPDTDWGPQPGRCAPAQQAGQRGSASAAASGRGQELQARASGPRQGGGPQDSGGQRQPWRDGAAGASGRGEGSVWSHGSTAEATRDPGPAGPGNPDKPRLPLGCRRGEAYKVKTALAAQPVFSDTPARNLRCRRHRRPVARTRHRDRAAGPPSRPGRGREPHLRSRPRPRQTRAHNLLRARWPVAPELSQAGCARLLMSFLKGRFPHRWFLRQPAGGRAATAGDVRGDSGFQGPSHPHSGLLPVLLEIRDCSFSSSSEVRHK